VIILSAVYCIHRYEGKTLLHIFAPRTKQELKVEVVSLPSLYLVCQSGVASSTLLPFWASPSHSQSNFQPTNCQISLIHYQITMNLFDCVNIYSHICISICSIRKDHKDISSKKHASNYQTREVRMTKYLHSKRINKYIKKGKKRMLRKHVKVQKWS